MHLCSAESRLFSVVIPGPPALAAGGTRNPALNFRRQKLDSGLLRHEAGAAPGMTSFFVTPTDFLELEI